MRCLGIVLVCLVGLSTVLAEPPTSNRLASPPPQAAQATETEPWTVDDVLLAERASDFQLSPDGRWAVWVKSAIDTDKGEAVSHLVRTELATKCHVELTRGPDSCERPLWSPDGKLVAFQSNRPGPKPPAKPKGRGRAEGDDEPKTQLWLIDPFGGEPWRLTDFPRGITGFRWAGPDALVFVAAEEESHHEKTTKEERKDTSVVVEDEAHEPPVRLFRVEVKTKKVTRLTDNADRIEWAEVSPDGRRAVARHNRSFRFGYDNKVKPVILLHDFTTGEQKRIFDDPKFNIAAVRWAADGRSFYATNWHNSRPQIAEYPAVIELFSFDLATGQPARIELDWENGLADQDANNGAPGVVVTPDGFLTLLADGTRPRAARYRRDGDTWKREWLAAGEHDRHVFGLQAAADGKSLVYAYSTASRPTQWYHATLDGVRLDKPAAVTSLNESFGKRKTARTEIVRWKGSRDEEVEGVLYYPHDHQPGRKAPLVVTIHGGPAAADLDMWEENWAYAANLLCQRGAFVLKPNYHGSANYGLKWMESIGNGNYYDLEVPDIEKGVDALIERGLADPDRLGVAGWSNGAILAIALTVTTTRYKAAVAGAGDVDWTSDWGNCEFGEMFDRFYLGKSPLEDPQLYFRKSPFYRLDRVRTPTLILFGTEDRAVPTQQGWMHYRALQQLGQTDVRFVLFPGEKHGPKKYVHQRRKLEEELAWFDRHLFKSEKSAHEALKDDSPLARTLKRQAARRDGERYGEVVAGVLVPETVSYRGLRVGRFEVTRAQFRAFDVNYPVAAGEENYPASGVTFDQARAYCRWLSEKTGTAYRLPNESEADNLYGATEPGENTLDYWAGYAVNPDDARRLRDKVAELNGAAPLLRPVGRFRAAGREEAVFDLGGNVAEWTTTADGQPKLSGGSADGPADAKQAVSQATPAYRGFRVVREEKPAPPK